MKKLSNKRVPLLLLAGSGLAIIASQPAIAQDAADSPAVVQEDTDNTIIVRARRVEENLQDVPISITVVDQEELSRRNISDATDLALTTPSLSSNQRFGGGKATFGLRGFNQESNTSPAVGVYFADVPAPRGGGSFAAGDGAGPGSFFDLENVQVLKGPQGTLFGRNTTGGAILLVPARPEREVGGFAELTVGNYDAKRLQVVVNLPAGDNLRMRAGVDWHQRDGYLTNNPGALGEVIGPDDFGDIDYISGRFSLIADFSDNIENYTILRYTDSQTNGSLQHPFYIDPGRPGFAQSIAANQIAATEARGDGFYDVVNSNEDAKQNFEEWGVINTTTFDVSDNFTITNLFSYSELREDFSTNIYGLDGNYSSLVPAIFFNNLFVNTYATPGLRSTAQSTLVEELRFSGTAADGRLVYQFGGYYEDSSPIGFSSNRTALPGFNCTDPANFGCGGGTVQESALKRSFESRALFAQGSYDLTEALTVTLGARYTWDKAEGIGQIIKFTGGRFQCGDGTLGVSDRTDCTSSFTQKSDRPTWLVSLDYEATDDVLLYAKYARGYRAGGVSPQFIGIETWGPEKLDSYEVGLKSSFFGAVEGRFNISAFYNDFQDQQLLFGTTGNPAAGVLGGTVITNTGESRIFGVEVDAAISPFEGFTISGAYTYLDTELESVTVPTDPLSLTVPDPNNPAVMIPVYTSISNTNREGNPLTYSPEHQFNISATYELPLPASIGDVAFTAAYFYTDEQYANFVQSTTGVFPGLLQERNLVNLNLDWDRIGGSPVGVSFFVTNLTKEQFYVSTTGTVEGQGYDSYVPNQPRMYGARLRIEY